jgi:DNA-binding NtrC family response regulator
MMTVNESERLRVLVVDEDSTLLLLQNEIMKDHPCVFRGLAQVEGLIPRIQEWNPDVILLGLDRDSKLGVIVPRMVGEQGFTSQVILLANRENLEAAIEGLRNGAFGFLIKPLADHEAVVLKIIKAGHNRKLANRNVSLASMVEGKKRFGRMVGVSPLMTHVFDQLDGIVRYGANALIQGEWGTGKELAARGIHERGSRSTGQFVPVNCATLPSEMMDRVLFGRTGRNEDGEASSETGLADEADGGILFLNEIGKVPLETQSRLVRLLQTGEFQRVGCDQPLHVDIQVIATTTEDLSRRVNENGFREDLYHCLGTVRVMLPALRERQSDICLLAQYFVWKQCLKEKRDVQGFDNRVKNVLERYRWPGNVRELENTMERAVAVCGSKEITLKDLPESLRLPIDPDDRDTDSLLDLPYREAREIARNEFEQAYITRLLKLAKGNLSRAARMVGMDRANFRRALRKARIDPAVCAGIGETR